MNVQRNLRGAQADLAATVGRLNGLRINSAKDDAAGLAITERMTTQINGLAISSETPATVFPSCKPQNQAWGP